MDKPLKSAWGSVKVYVRHSKSCPYAESLDNSKCHCTWWLYSWTRGKPAKRRSLTTPSKAEAQKIANDELEGMNPEIAAAREVKAKEKEQLMSVVDAINLFVGRRELDGSESTKAQYRSALGFLDQTGGFHGMLLLALKRDNIEFIQQVTTAWLQRWHQSVEWDKLAPTTRTQRWGVVRILFRFLHEQGIVASNPASPIRSARSNNYFNNVPYTDEQYAKILEAASSNRRVYCFIELLRWSGMDLQDAIQLRLDMIDADGVLTYNRGKTKCEGVIPLEPHMPALLKSVPLDKNCSREMPFRRLGRSLYADHIYWYARVKAVLAKAGIVEQRYRQKDGVITIHGANVKSFRHSFACHYLALGYRTETVAKMLGHSRIETTQLRYAPWTKGRNDAHIREVRQAQQAAAKKQQALNIPAKEGETVTVQ